MKYFYLILCSCAMVAIALGIFNISAAKPDRGLACENRTFDYINFIKIVRGQKEKNLKLINKLQTDNLNNPLKREKIEYFNSVNNSFVYLIPLVEKQIAMRGATYSCLEDGYKLLMSDLDYPTFNSLSKREEIEFLWKKMEKKQEVSLTRILEIVFGPLVALTVGILGFYKERKKEKYRVSR